MAGGGCVAGTYSLPDLCVLSVLCLAQGRGNSFSPLLIAGVPACGLDRVIREQREGQQER